jgi:hypothetical protein
MTQLAPTTLYYAQAMALLKEIEMEYSAGLLKNIDDVQQRISQAYSSFNSNAGRPLTSYEHIVPGEPPLSEKINRFWMRLEQDLNICQQQLEFLQASAIHVHNFIKTEILKAQHLNAQASNKVKTLQLYSNAHDSDVIRFGDYFRNTDFIDADSTVDAQRATLQSPGIMTLKRETRKILGPRDGVTMKVLPTSNGFLGNNQEIKNQSPIQNLDEDLNELEFIAQTDRRAKLVDLIDQKPNTWIEYEKYLVSEQDRNLAQNFNFVYADTSKLNDGSDTTESVKVDWANGPDGGVLRLSIEFDLGSQKNVNGFSFTPYGLELNKNYALKISRVETSPDATNWIPLNPENVWIAVEANLQTASVNDNVSIGYANWSFEDRVIRYVRLHIEQPHPNESKIGHLYYEKRPTVNPGRVSIPTPVDDDDDLLDDEGNPLIARHYSVENASSRVEGPIPTIDRPHRYYGSTNRIIGGLIQKVEYFMGKRWVIGIRDCTIDHSTYSNSSVIVSKPFKINGLVDRVAIESDIYIPSSYNSNDIWVRFYVSPDNGNSWYPISRIQDDFLGLPEVIAFNDPLPEEFREQGVTYHQVNGSVNSVRVKIEISRPADQPSTTPVVKSYTLKIRKK